LTSTVSTTPGPAARGLAGTVSPAGPRRRAGRGLYRNDRYYAWLYMLPWALGVLWLVVLPVILAVYWSFTHYNLLTAPTWAGFANYQALYHDPVFWTSVRNTLFLTVVGVFAGTVMGLGTALLLNKQSRTARVFRTGIFLPAVVPPVTTAIGWLFILNPQYGLLNAALKSVGLPPIGWLNDPAYAKYGLLMMVLWGSVGQIMMTFSAALQEIPAELIEAATLDGAGRFGVFRHITFPLLAPVTLYNVVIATLFYFQFFEQAFVVSPTSLGAPSNSTLTYSLYIYQQAFTYLHMGDAAAASCILLVVSATVIALFFTVNKRFGDR
jgi:multiple sugar transport system permease protein